MAVFVAVADRGSFVAAAEEFAISPTMVSKHLRSLEDRVGARLINRTTRRQALTEIGRAYLERCRQVVEDAKDADASAQELTARPRGVLKVHAPVTLGSRRLAPMLATYLRRYPEVTVSLVLADRPVDLLEEGLDAAIKIGLLGDSGLVARGLGTYRMWLCAAPAYLSEFGAPRTAQQLADHDCLGFAYWAKKDTWKLREDGASEVVSVNNRMTINNGEALRAAAIAGAGIVMQPEVLLEEDVTAGRLVRILPDVEAPSRPIHLIYPQDRRPTPKLRSFVDFVVTAFRKS